MNSLHVVCFGDGRPGHEKQTQAVLSALNKLASLVVTPVKMEAEAGAKRLFRGLGSFLPNPKERLKPQPHPIDLIIGAGSSTHLPMIGLKMRTRAKLVACMSPDPWVAPWFDLCLVPRHDRPPHRKKYFATFGPPCLMLDTSRHDPRKGLILAGGVDIKSHHWDTAYFMSQITSLISKAGNVLWTIPSSPRTPSDTIQQLRALDQAQKNITFFSADETPRGWIESAYEKNAQVWVTADSVSMVYEALTAGCRVGVLPVKWKQMQNKFQKGIDDLMAQGLISDFDRWINHAELPLSAQPLNEAERCAKEILRRWWPNRLV